MIASGGIREQASLGTVSVQVNQAHGPTHASQAFAIGQMILYTCKHAQLDQLCPPEVGT